MVCMRYYVYIMQCFFLNCAMGMRLLVNYHKLWSTSTGTSFQRLRNFVVQIMRGTYNHGVLFKGVKMR